MNGDLLKELRQEKGFSQAQLAQETGISQSTIARWELGQCSPSAEALKAMADYFQVRVDDFYDGFYKSIKEVRCKKHLRQAQVAKELGIAQTTYSGYERGYHKPTPEILLKLADLFDVTVDELLGRALQQQLFDDAHIIRLKIFDVYAQLTSEQQNELYNIARGMAIANSLAKSNKK